MKTVNITVTSAEKASRLELFIRFVYGTILAIILCILGIFVSIAIVIQWFYMLFLGKRQKEMQKFINAWLILLCQLHFYCNLSTDERPPLFPEF